MKEKNLDVMDLLDKSFEQLKEALKNNGDRFCVPYNGSHYRISEQEIKCCFIEIFVKDAPKGYLYSVETPTIEKYRFSEKGKQVIPRKDPNGRRGNIDLVIFRGNNADENRVAILEFKANFVDNYKYAKDFCKLKEEPGDISRVFVELFIINDGTEKNRLKDKLLHNNKGAIARNTFFVGYGLNLSSLDESIKITKEDLQR